MARRTFFGWLRLVILLTVLLVVGLNAWFDRALTTDWDLPLRVTVYPIATGDEDVAAYAGRLETDDFAAAQKRMAATDVNDRWQAGMAQYFQNPEGANPDQAMQQLAEYFHLD